mgnify:CR=1 FL=1
MLSPKKTKYRKAFKGRIAGNAKGGTDLNFGSYGLKTVEPERITARQIEAARQWRFRPARREAEGPGAVSPHPVGGVGEPDRTGTGDRGGQPQHGDVPETAAPLRRPVLHTGPYRPRRVGSARTSSPSAGRCSRHPRPIPTTRRPATCTT